MGTGCVAGAGCDHVIGEPAGAVGVGSAGTTGGILGLDGDVLPEGMIGVCLGSSTFLSGGGVEIGPDVG
jgi:hypothetical protein